MNNNSRKNWCKVGKNIYLYYDGCYRAIWRNCGSTFGWNLETFKNKWIPVDSNCYNTLDLLNKIIKKINRNPWRKVSENIRLYYDGRYRAVWGKHHIKSIYGGKHCTQLVLGWNLETFEKGKWISTNSRRHRTLGLVNEVIKKLNFCNPWRKVSKNIRLYYDDCYRAVWGKHLSLYKGWALGWNLETLKKGKWIPTNSFGRHRTLYLLHTIIKKIKGLI